MSLVVNGSVILKIELEQWHMIHVQPNVTSWQRDPLTMSLTTKPWHTPDRASNTCYIIAILLNITQVSHSPVLKKSNLGGTTVFTQNNIIIIFVDVLFLNNWIFWVKTLKTLKCPFLWIYVLYYFDKVFSQL